ncbi:hypothetical protein P691DRAFT_779323 [Macrolepiota fuliginosa MF-IS2]|uniref:Uncharacterized protein n=1 Tax=Macrolepiota fuliginosa MF-IS2 TaxID=1400762 RepID=A0A9P6BYJ9_9AGAR|nr:hypothetical protein P691DRAFT_779323 [Macrolepiota fuliginosa MF-IS2]
MSRLFRRFNGGPAELNTSLKSWYNVIVADGPKSQELSYTSNAWVDVRDAALAHVLALQKEAAGGERIVFSAGSFVWQEWLDIVNTIQPYPLPNHSPTKGIPGLEKSHRIQYDTAKEKIFGIKFKTMGETSRGTLEDFAQKGWWWCSMNTTSCLGASA